MHPKKIQGSLINHAYTKKIPDKKDFTSRQKKKWQSKIIQGVQNVFAPQGKLFPLHPKIVYGSLINHTYTKIIPDIYDFKYRKKSDMSKIIQGTQIYCSTAKNNSLVSKNNSR